MNKQLYTLLLVLSSFMLSAQETPAAPQMAEAFRQEGKIYVVIAVLVIIFLALIAYLVSIDIKLKKIEKRS